MAGITICHFDGNQRHPEQYIHEIQTTNGNRGQIDLEQYIERLEL